MPRSYAVLAAALLVMGCRAGESTTPAISAASVPTITYANASPTAQSRANFVFADSVDVAVPGSPASWSSTGVRGDGRLRTGAVSTGGPSNEYQGDFCGVYGIMETQAGAKTTFNTDPDINWTATMQSACGSARLFSFYLGGLNAAPTMMGPHSVIDSLGALSVGQVSTRMARFGVQMTNCDGIRFGNEYPPANNVKVTRLADVLTNAGAVARRWLVESRGSHRGACVVGTKKGFVANGVTYYLPFAITITEVPAPSPVYP